MNVLANELKSFIESHDDNASVDSNTFYTVELSARIKIPHSLKYRVKKGLKIWQRFIEILDIRIGENENSSLSNVPLEDVPHKIITVKPPKQNRNITTVSPKLPNQIGIYIDIQDTGIKSDSQDVNTTNIYDNENSSNNIDDDDNDDDNDDDDFILNDDSDDSWSPQNEHRQNKSQPSRQATSSRRLSSRIKTKSEINQLASERDEIPCDTKTDQHKKKFKGPSNTIAMNVEDEVSYCDTEKEKSQLKIKEKPKKTYKRKAKASTENEKKTRRQHKASDNRVKHVLTCKKCGETFNKIRNYNVHLDTHEIDYLKSQMEIDQDQNNCSSTSQEMKVSPEDLKEVQLLEDQESNILPEIHPDSSVTSITENINQQTLVESFVKNYSLTENPSLETMIKVEESTVNLVDPSVSFDTDDMVTERQDTSNKKDESMDQVISPKSKKNYDILTCEHCGKWFDRIVVYANHMLTHSTERPYQCNTCNKSFKTRPTLNSHQLLAHSGKMYQCNICNRYFTLKNSLKSHVATVHNGERNEICHICGKGFTRKEHLRKHISLHSDVKPFKCNDCDRHFQTEVLLKTHSKHHLLEKKHICDICGRAFKTQSNLKSHQLSHAGVRNFSCSICNMAFIHKASLKKHMRTHDSNRKVVQCNLCSKIFKNKTNLSRHNITAHSDLKPFQCEFCSKTFKIKSLLDQHANLHKLEKNYSCKYCDKRFAFNSSLYSHVKLHHKDKFNVSDLATGIKCYLCGNFFESNFALASHVRTHNNNVCIS